jgi:drug/metabolite transporter (DMT)-like permease
MSSFKGAFLYNTSPFLSALFSYFVFSEKMTHIKWLGLFIGLSGFLPELMSQAPTETSWFSMFFLSRAELLMLASVVSSVIGWTVMRSLALEGNSIVAVNAVGMIGGGLLALFTSTVFESWQPIPVFDWPAFIKLTALIIVVANVLFYNLYGYLLKQYTATFLSFCGFMSPLFAALFGWLFLSERVAWHFFFSVFVVIIGLLLFYKQELKQGYIRKR